MANNSFWAGLSTGLSGMEDEDEDLFKVNSTISTSTNIQPDDVVKTKSALNTLGDYEPPKFGITEIPDQSMINGLKNFQSKNGLKVDGVMKPGGPTENAIGKTLAQNGISQKSLLKVPKTKEQKVNIFKPVQPSAQELADQQEIDRQKAHDQEEAAKHTVLKELQSLMKDERYPKNEAYLKHVQTQFEKAYPGNVEYDETGKMIQPKAVIQASQVEAFDIPQLIQSGIGDDPAMELSDQVDPIEETPNKTKSDESQSSSDCASLKEKMNNLYEAWEKSADDEDKYLKAIGYHGDIADAAWDDFVNLLLGGNVDARDIPEKPSSDDKDPRERGKRKGSVSISYIEKLLKKVNKVIGIADYLGKVSNAYYRYDAALKFIEDSRSKWLSAIEETPRLWNDYKNAKKEFNQNCNG